MLPGLESKLGISQLGKIWNIKCNNETTIDFANADTTIATKTNKSHCKLTNESGFRHRYIEVKVAKNYNW